MAKIERVDIHSQRPLLAELERAVTWGFQHAKIDPLIKGSGLEKVTVVVASQGKSRRCMGLFTNSSWSNREGDESISEIQMSSEYLKLEPVEIVAVMLHEATHLWCFNADVKDTSSGGVYHNKRFKDHAELMGLGCPEMVEGPAGFGYTHVPAALRKDIETGFKPKFDVFDKFRLTRPKRKGQIKTIPFVCDCGTIRVPVGRVSNGIDLFCNVCDTELMEKMI